MQFDTFTIQRSTTATTDIIDITDETNQQLRDLQVTTGQLTLFIGGSTAALSTIEFEPGAVSDLKAAIERLLPTTLSYDHDRRWGDGNGYSHVRAAWFQPDLTIPVIDGRMALGTWQQVILLDFDNRPRQRQVLGQVLHNG